MTLRAYAKINLGLRILRKRADGYHDIETIFHRINLSDELTFAAAPTISLTSNIAELPTDEQNLCIRAAQLLQQHWRVERGVRIKVIKNIPLGAGLGGGSSDAASTLIGLAQLWNLPINDDELRSIALQLGSDVPYFLKQGTAYATGRGEVLEYFDFPLPYWIVVVYPKRHVSTAWAYGNVQVKSQNEKAKTQTSPKGIPRTNRGLRTTLKNLLLENINNPPVLKKLLRNDLEPLVLRRYPEVAQVKNMLYDSGAVFAQMSGSGSAVYGLFSTEEIARQACGKFPHDYKVFLSPSDFQPH